MVESLAESRVGTKGESLFVSLVDLQVIMQLGVTLGKLSLVWVCVISLCACYYFSAPNYSHHQYCVPK